MILKFPNQNQMILSCDFKKIESFRFDSKIFNSESNVFVVILEKSNHLIFIQKFSNQNQMILSCDFTKIESFRFDSKIFKSEPNDFVV